MAGEHGIKMKIKRVKLVNFCDFVKSWGKLDQRIVEEEIQAVKSVLGIIQHLERVGLEECNLDEDRLRILHDVFIGVKIDELGIDGNPNIAAQGWYYVGQIVHQSTPFRHLYARDCDVTDECLERFVQGMDGAQLHDFDMSCDDSKNVDSIDALLKLLPLINGTLDVYGWQFSEEQKKELQKKLDEDRLKSPIIKYGKRPNGLRYLAPSPLKKSRTLPEVEGLQACNTNGSVIVQWNSLHVDKVSYRIVVNEVGEPIDTDDTSYQLSSLPLNSHKWYDILIWGFTNDGISKRVAGIYHETGRIDKSQQGRKAGTSKSSRKRTCDVEDPELSSAKKSKETITAAITLGNWLATECQFEAPLDLQAIINKVTGTTQARPNDIVVGTGNPAMQQTSELSVERLERITSTSTLLPEMQRTVNASADENTGVQASYDYSAGPSSVNAHQSTAGQTAPAFVDQASNMVPDMMGHHTGMGENTQSSFQQVFQRQEEMIKMQSEVMKMKDEMIKMKEEKIKMLEKIMAQDREIDKLKKDNEKITLLKNKISAPEQLIQGTSTSPQDENRSQIPFTLPMNTKEDVEENEKLLEEKQNWQRLIEFLKLKVGGDGKDAVWPIMANLFSNQLAQDYSWRGSKAKNALCKLKMAKIIYRVCIEKNVDNKGCEALAIRWLKNASDRSGGRRRRERAEKNANKNRAGGKV